MELLKEQDANKAAQVFHRIERLLIDDVPIIPIFGYSQTHGEWLYTKRQMVIHPYTVTQPNSVATVIWLGKRDSTWATRAR